jgi:predicted Zn finger-like uncharacterized protein
MNCVRCHYLLWDLPENRCPECGEPFEVTDYAFAPRAVAVVCPHCEQSYEGTDAQGWPVPRRFECGGCHHPIAVETMRVRPLREDAVGEPIRCGTPWERRGRVGYVRAFLDGVARLAMQPGEFFRLYSARHGQGEIVFSILCAYVAVAGLIAILLLLQGGGLLRWLPDLQPLVRSRAMLLLVAMIPLAQIVWNYLYGVLIQTVLAVLGQQGSDYEASVRAVAFGSAVLPAVLLLPPIGLLWYVSVVSCGVQHLHGTTKSQALVATLIPMLLAGNILLVLGYSYLS